MWTGRAEKDLFFKKKEGISFVVIFVMILKGNWGSFGEPWEPNLQGFLRAKNASAPSGASDGQWDGFKHTRTSKMKLSLKRGAYFA